jgi:hypothetical protein
LLPNVPAARKWSVENIGPCPLRGAISGLATVLANLRQKRLRKSGIVAVNPSPLSLVYCTSVPARIFWGERLAGKTPWRNERPMPKRYGRKLRVSLIVVK